MLLGAGVLVVALVGAACRSPEAAEQMRRLAPASRPYEADIPVPEGFRFAEQVSEDLTAGGSRSYLRHVYEGSAAKVAVRQFYREHMPLARWVATSDGNVEGEYTMRFEKQHETCTVLIRDRRGIAPGTRVQVIVAPFERVAAPPSGWSER
jgi:hypothetical protein